MLSVKLRERGIGAIDGELVGRSMEIIEENEEEEGGGRLALQMRGGKKKDYSKHRGFYHKTTALS